jgi:hypothetical protein
MKDPREPGDMPDPGPETGEGLFRRTMKALVRVPKAEVEELERRERRPEQPPAAADRRRKRAG